MSSSVDIVKSFYELFKAGDVGPLIAAIDENAVFNDLQTSLQKFPDDIPWAIRLEGKEACTTYFQRLADSVSHQLLEIKNIFGDERNVVVVTREIITWKKTGKTAELEMLHKWELTADGKIAKFQGYPDSHVLINELRV